MPWVKQLARMIPPSPVAASRPMLDISEDCQAIVARSDPPAPAEASSIATRVP